MIYINNMKNRMRKMKSLYISQGDMTQFLIPNFLLFNVNSMNRTRMVGFSLAYGVSYIIP